MHIARKVLLASTLCLMTAGTVSSMQNNTLGFASFYTAEQANQLIDNPLANPNALIAIAVRELQILVKNNVAECQNELNKYKERYTTILDGEISLPPPEELCSEESSWKLSLTKMMKLYKEKLSQGKNLPKKNVSLRSVTPLLEKIQEQNDEITTLNNKITTLTEKNKENEKKLEYNEQQINGFQNTQNQLKNKLATLQGKESTTRYAFDSVNNKNKELQQEIEKYIKAAKLAEEAKNELQKKNNNLIGEIQQLKNNNEALLEEPKNTLWLAAQALNNTTADNIINDVREKNQTLQDDLEKIKNEKQALTKGVEELKQELLEKDKTINEKEKKIKELEALLEQQKKPDDDSLDGPGNSNSGIIGGYGNTPLC